MTIFNADGTRKAEPAAKPAEKWTPLKDNPKVEVNEHGIYRTIDLADDAAEWEAKHTKSTPVDEYYGYEGWGLFPDGE